MHLRQTFSEALKLVKAELVPEVGECQVGASATPGVDEVLLAAEEDAVGVVAVEGSAAVVRATVDPSTLVQVEEFDRFFTGDMVEVLGLQSARHLNGCRGCVVEILSDRFGVLLQGHAEPNALKGFNLRKVPMITKVQKIVEVPQVEFVDPETVYERQSFARGSVCPRVAAAGNDEFAYNAVSAEVGRDLSLEVRGQPTSVPARSAGCAGCAVASGLEGESVLVHGTQTRAGSAGLVAESFQQDVAEWAFPPPLVGFQFSWVFFIFLCVLLDTFSVIHAFMKLEVFAEPCADQDVALVLRQVVFAGGLEVQVSVEALVGEFSGRSAKDIVQSVISVRDATQARKIDWLELDWASGPFEGAPFTQQEQDEVFAADESHFLASDRDGDGLISFLELKRAVKLMSLPLVGAKVKFRAADADGDGSLGFVEYLVALSDWQPEAESSG